MLTHKDVDEIQDAFAERRKLKKILEDAVEWFDAMRPKTVAMTLPTWYGDARKYLRDTDPKV